MRKHYILSILAISILLNSVCINNNNNSASALSYSTNIGIGFTFNPTLFISLSSNDLVISNLVPGSSSDSNEITINVATNNVYGYNLYTTVGSEEYNNTNLTNTSNDTSNTSYTFTSISPTTNFSNLTDFSNNAPNNTWAYSFKLSNDSSWSNYNGLPLYTTNTPTRLIKTTNPSEDTINFKIAAKAGSTQPSGIYSNIVNFYAVTKPSLITLADAYAAEGKELYHGYYKMQDMTHTICEETEDIGSQLQVIDIRDDKVYWISKLADNNCWMTQNLDLDLTSDPTAENYIALTSENTDLNDTISAAYQDGYTVNENGIITWVPERDTIAYNNLNSTTWQNDNNHPYSYDYLDSNGNPVYPDNNVAKQVAGNHGLSGNYYNWPATLANNNSSNTISNPANSICPKGWRLPNITDNDFGNLLVSYDIIGINISTSYLDGGFNTMGSIPLYFVKGGYIYSGALHDLNDFGYYWSSSSEGGGMARGLGFNNNNIYPTYNGIRYAGGSLRCLAR